MWDKFDGAPYTREQFQKMVDAIPIEKLKWVKYLTCHNTAAPSIAQWLGPVKPQQRIINLQNYYEHTLGWRSGPHGFIPPAKDVCIWGFTPLDTKGVHASCFNSSSIGLEMVGDFDTEEFNSGPGALVRDNTIFVLAVLYNKLGLRPDGYVYGVSGLHLHNDCKRDNHACPGKKMRVGREEFVQAVLAKMEELKPTKPKPAPAPVPVAAADVVTDITVAPDLPPPKIAAAASPAGAGLMSSITTTTASAAAINALAEQGSRLAEFVRKVKQTFWKTVVGTSAVAGATTVADPTKGNSATIAEWIAAHPVAFGCIVGGGLGLLVGILLIWIFAKRVEKWLLTAYKDGRYAPRES